jgi:hypothetical protein
MAQTLKQRLKELVVVREKSRQQKPRQYVQTSPQQLQAMRANLNKTSKLPFDNNDTDSDRSGSGVRHKQFHRMLTVDKHGRFGDLTINMKKLRSMELIAKKGRNVVARGLMSPDLFDLLTKRYNSRTKYSDDAIASYRRLAQLANIVPAPDSQNGKAKIIQGRIRGGAKARLSREPDRKAQSSKTKFVYYSNPDELVQRLHLIMGQIDNGNSSTSIREEASQILDKLLKAKILSEIQYQTLMERLL